MLQERLKQAREKAGLTQAAVAKEVGVTQPTYSDFEQGNRTPSLAVIKRLARLYACSIDYLAGE